jgi:urease gamma subunit
VAAGVKEKEQGLLNRKLIVAVVRLAKQEIVQEGETLEDLMEEVLEISKTMFAGNRFP